MCLSGFTDSHWMREAFGTVAYGFFPMRAMDAEVATLLDPLGERADPRRRPRARRRLLPGRRAALLAASLERMADKLRLGGMALPNGVLVHGPTSWGCAIRRPDGTIEVAAERKRFVSDERTPPLLRGPLKLLEAMAVLPSVRRALPRAQPAVRTAGRDRGDARQRARPARRARLAARDGDAGSALRGALVRAGGARASRLGPRGVPRRGTRFHRDLRARRAAREGARALRLAPRRADPAHGDDRQRARREGAARTFVRSRAQPRRSARSPSRPRSSRGWCATPSTPSRARSRGPVTSCSTASAPTSLPPSSSRSRTRRSTPASPSKERDPAARRARGRARRDARVRELVHAGDRSPAARARGDARTRARRRDGDRRRLRSGLDRLARSTPRCRSSRRSSTRIAPRPQRGALSRRRARARARRRLARRARPARAVRPALPRRLEARSRELDGEETLRLLAPRGVIVMDDLTPGRPGPDAVRDFWLEHPDVAATELQVSAGRRP